MNDRRLALGIDGGSIPGAALWGFDGYVWSTQGTLEEVAYRLVTHARLADVATAAEQVHVTEDSFRAAVATLGWSAKPAT